MTVDKMLGGMMMGNPLYNHLDELDTDDLIDTAE